MFKLIKNRIFKKNNDLGHNLPPGAHHYRAFVGPPEKYDIVSAMQFNLLTYLGLRENHYLLDIGCGSLRAGRLFIPYLLPQRYFGIDPEKWLIEKAIEKEIGKDLIRIKKPSFDYNDQFNLNVFKKKFDFILAQSVFSHASQNQIKKCLLQARKVMKMDSIFAATYIKGTRNYKDKNWSYPDIVKYTDSFINNIIKKQGFLKTIINWPHPNNQTWILIYFPRNKKKILPIVKRKINYNYAGT